MANYIELDALLADISNAIDHGGMGRVVGQTLMRYVKRIPAADVAPVVHGRWSDAGFGELPKHAPYGWACSVCGGISFNNEYTHCPHCGAKMDGGDAT